MDRGYRALLSSLVFGILLGWVFGDSQLRAQSPTPSQTPAASPSATAKSSPVPTAKPAESVSPGASVSVSTPVPKPAARVSNQEDAKSQGRRQAIRQSSEQQQIIEPEAPLPDEQTTLRKNVKLWQKLLPEEQRALVGPASERIREETEDAYNQSGLNLNDDQREVFALRFRQERRRLERELQEKANNERTRRLPLIIDQLKREFSRSATPALQQNGNNPVVRPPATQAPSVTPSPAMPGGTSGNLPLPTPSRA